MERGWTQEQLAARCGRHWTYLGATERGERNVTLRVVADLAAALEVDPRELFPSGQHPLEQKLNASLWDILAAIGAGFRTVADVKGKLAEHFLNSRLQQARAAGLIESVQWQDQDGQPDFLIGYRGRVLRLECKNVRSGGQFANPYRVEVQKTRNPMTGEPTRGYRFDEFEVLAACTFNQTGEWDYLYAATRNLPRRPRLPEFLVTMQPVPISPQGCWRVQLKDALDDCL